MTWFIIYATLKGLIVGFSFNKKILDGQKIWWLESWKEHIQLEITLGDTENIYHNTVKS